MGEAETRALLSARATALEKLDGLNVGLDFTASRRLRFWSRALGEVRPEAMAPSLWPLVDWAYRRLPQLWALLGARRTMFGEWLGLPGALPYPRRPDDFVALGLREGRRFVPLAAARAELAGHGFSTPPVLARGALGSLERLEALSRRSRWGGAAEGVVLETPRGWFKWVREDFVGARERGPHGESPAAHRCAIRDSPSRAQVTKHFAADRAAQAARELALVRTGAGAKLLRVERSARGTRLTLEHVGLGPWPRRASEAQVAALGSALRRLHGKRPAGLVLPELLPSPSAHALEASSPVARRLAPLLSAQERALSAGPRALCHGDLKRSNVRVDGEAVWLIDFERAFFAERAWELAAAAERLGLGAPLLPALWRAAGVRSGAEVARAALYRLAQAVALAGAPRLGGPTAEALARAARRQARSLARWLR